MHSGRKTGLRRGGGAGRVFEGLRPVIEGVGHIWCCGKGLIQGSNPRNTSYFSSKDAERREVVSGLQSIAWTRTVMITLEFRVERFGNFLIG